MWLGSVNSEVSVLHLSFIQFVLNSFMQRNAIQRLLNIDWCITQCFNPGILTLWLPNLQPFVLKITSNFNLTTVQFILNCESCAVKPSMSPSGIWEPTTLFLWSQNGGIASALTFWWQDLPGKHPGQAHSIVTDVNVLLDFAFTFR